VKDIIQKYKERDAKEKKKWEVLQVKVYNKTNNWNI
jgi:hypothetical protein